MSEATTSCHLVLFVLKMQGTRGSHKHHHAGHARDHDLVVLPSLAALAALFSRFEGSSNRVAELADAMRRRAGNLNFCGGGAAVFFGLGGGEGHPVVAECDRVVLGAALALCGPRVSIAFAAMLS